MKKRLKKKIQKQLSATKQATVLSTEIAKREREAEARREAALPPYLRKDWRPLQPGERQINDVDPNPASAAAPGLDRSSKINKMMIDLGRAVCGDRGVDWRGHRR